MKPNYAQSYNSVVDKEFISKMTGQTIDEFLVRNRVESLKQIDL